VPLLKIIVDDSDAEPNDLWMARLLKPQLGRQIEEAIREGGWTPTRNNASSHPFYFNLRRDAERVRIKCYIWNLTHGGNNRPDDEYRIQPTSTEKFTPESGLKTLILGWWDDVGVFAGWDVRQHLKPLGKSSSFQIKEHALRQALLSGFAPYVKDSGETAIAFRPDFLVTYIRYLESLHDSGNVPKELSLLTELSEDPDAVDEAAIETKTAPARKRALVSTWRTLRDNDFRRRVLTAYSFRCAICGLQLRLIEGAHILSVDEPGSTDQTSNGVALCVLHHRAYDAGLIAFDTSFKVHVSDFKAADLTAAHLAGGLKQFKASLKPIMMTPPDKKDRPDKAFVKKANQARGWRLS
jgi:putative restriction endonuclease